jgi:hypothetical protein
MLLTCTIYTFFTFAGQGFAVGPSADLVIISVKIDTWGRYATLLALIATITIGDVVINEITEPILGFNVYNPDKKVITEFHRHELWFLASFSWIVKSMRNVVTPFLAISQIDVAIFTALVVQLTSVFMVGFLLREKTFPMDTPDIENGLLTKTLLESSGTASCEEK